jgi:tetratricopeptide (TPR) repeat protein
MAAQSAARGDDVDLAREHYRKATNGFELGNFEESIREYAEAYRLKSDPAILYNLGQANRLANHPAEALHFYRMYLSKVPDAPNRSEIESKIDTLGHELEQQRRAREAAAAAQAAPLTAPASTPPLVPVRKLAEPAPPGKAKEVSGIAVGVVGVGLLDAGIAFGVLASNAGSDLTRQAKAGSFSYSDQQNGKRDQLLEPIFLAIGGAALVTGVVLWVLGNREGRASRRVSVATVPIDGSHFAGSFATF